MPVLLASASAVAWGLSDFLGGFVTRRLPALVTVMWSQVAGLALAVVVAPLLGGPGLTRPVVIWGALAGLGGNLGLVALYQGLATGSMAVVAPISAVVGSALPIAVGLVVGERPGLAAWVGIALALPAIWLVSRTRGGVWGDGLGLGVLAGVGFGLFFVFLSFAPDDAGLWPLVPSRVVSIAAMAAIVGVRRVPSRVPARVAPGVALVGIGDMAANMAFLAAVQQGLLSLVAVVASLYPAFTVLLARLVLAEPIGRRRWAGIGLALCSLALISA